jgi:hypothetical protein
MVYYCYYNTTGLTTSKNMYGKNQERKTAQAGKDEEESNVYNFFGFE